MAMVRALVLPGTVANAIGPVNSFTATVHVASAGRGFSYSAARIPLRDTARAPVLSARTVSCRADLASPFALTASAVVTVAVSLATSTAALRRASPLPFPGADGDEDDSRCVAARIDGGDRARLDRRACAAGEATTMAGALFESIPDLATLDDSGVAGDSGGGYRGEGRPVRPKDGRR